MRAAEGNIVVPVLVGLHLCVCVHVYSGRLKVTVIALLRPAHLPQSVSNQSCSLKRAAPVITMCVFRVSVSYIPHVPLAFSCHLTCICIDGYLYSRKTSIRVLQWRGWFYTHYSAKAMIKHYHFIWCSDRSVSVESMSSGKRLFVNC